MLKPGTYKLTRDVRNPKPDRRKNYDWRARPVWSAGLTFIVEDQPTARDDDMLEGIDLSDDSRAKIRAAINKPWTRILLVGHPWAHNNINANSEAQYAALEAALEPCEETFSAMFTRLDVKDRFAQWLVESGRLTRRAFEILWNTYQTTDDGNADAIPQGPQLTSAEIVGDAIADDDDDEDAPSFSAISDELQRHWSELGGIQRKLRAIPTTRALADRLTRVCEAIEDIDSDLANGDHMGAK